MKNPKIIGLCGNARAGKDTFFNVSRNLLNERKVFPERFAFADALKQESDKFLISNLGISAFTEDTKEKELIRPFLVTYGTHLRRKLDPDCWIKKIEPNVLSAMVQGVTPVITDVRFGNEADWVRSLGGVMIHIEREGFGPANHDEAENEPILIKKSNQIVRWETLGDNVEEYTSIVEKTLNNIFENEYQLL